MAVVVITVQNDECVPVAVASGSRQLVLAIGRPEEEAVERHIAYGLLCSLDFNEEELVDEFVRVRDGQPVGARGSEHWVESLVRPLAAFRKFHELEDATLRGPIRLLEAALFGRDEREGFALSSLVEAALCVARPARRFHSHQDRLTTRIDQPVLHALSQLHDHAPRQTRPRERVGSGDPARILRVPSPVR